MILLMFLAGLETHLPDFRRRPRPPPPVGKGGVARPVVGGVGAAAPRDFVDPLGGDIGCWEDTLAAIEERV